MDEKKQLFLDNLRRSSGIITQACMTTEIKREEYEEWIKDFSFKRECYLINLETEDYVEAQLLKLIKDRNVAAVTFYCKTKLKHKGYIDKVEIHEEDKNIQIVINDKIIDPNEQD